MNVTQKLTILFALFLTLGITSVAATASGLSLSDSAVQPGETIFLSANSGTGNDLTFAIDKDGDGTFETHIETLDPSVSTLTSYDTTGVEDGEYTVGVVEEENDDGQEDAMNFDEADSKRNLAIDSQDPNTPAPAFSESGSNDGFDTDSTVEFNWDNPGDNGQAGVENYKVKYSTNGGDYSDPVSQTSTSYSVEADHGDNVKIKVAAVDSAGNEGSYGESSTIEVDTQKPEVTDVTVTPSPVTDSDTGSSVDVEVEFNEDMDQSTDPTVEVTGLDSEYTVEGSWDGSKTWLGTFTVDDDNEEATGTVEVSGAKDEAGNTMETDSSSTFEVDTNSPTLDSVTYQPVENTNKETLELAFSEGVSNVGSATDYTVTYDPDGDFGTTGGQRTVSVDSVTSNGNTVDLTIPDQSQETDAGGVFQVDAPSGIEDAVGNTLESNSATSSTVEQFDVTAPDVRGFSATHDGDWNKVIVKIQADEKLDADTISAEIADSNDNSVATLNNFDPTDNTNEYKATYTEESTVEDEYTVTLNGAEDTSGNSVSSSGSSDTVEVDTRDPSVTDVLIEDTTVGSTELVKDGDTVKVTATVEDRNIDSTGEITADLTSLGGTSDANPGNYEGTTATWTVQDANTDPENGDLTVQVTATDKASNQGTGDDTITADNMAPTVESFELNVVDTDDVEVVLETSEKLGETSDDLQVDLTKPNGNTRSYEEGDFTYGDDSNSYSVTYEGSVDGTYNADLLAARDTVGNDGSKDESASATVDTEDPTVTITKPDDGVAINDETAIEGTASDGNGIKKVELEITDSDQKTWNGDSFTDSETSVEATLEDTDSWSYNSGPTSEGTYDVVATATEGDSADNSQTDSSKVTYDIDNTIDTAAINGVQAGQEDAASTSVTVGTTQDVFVEVEADDKNFKDAEIALSGNDGQATSKSLDSGSSSPRDIRFYLGSSEEDVQEGTYDVDLSVDDTAGNGESVRLENAVTVDGTVELNDITATADGDQVDITVDADEKLKDLEVGVGSQTLTWDDFTESDTDYTASTQALSDGEYTATVETATDQYSNTVTNPGLSDSATVDEEGPTFTVNEGTDPGPVQTDTINVDVSDDGSSAKNLEYGFSDDGTCDGEDSYGNSFTSGEDFTVAGDRDSYLCVKAEDDSGNVAYGQVGQLNTDNTPPEVSEITTVSLEEDGDQSGVNGALVEFDEPVSDSSIKAGDWSIGGEQVDSVSNSGTDDSQVQLELTEPLDTTSSAEVTYTGSSLTDIAGNQLADVDEDSITELDGSEPVLEQAEINQDLSSSSKTVLDLRFSETVSTSSASTAALEEQVGGELRFDAQTGQTVQATYYRDGQQAVLNTGSIYTDDDGGEAREPEIESFTGVTDVERFRDAGADLSEYEVPSSNYEVSTESVLREKVDGDGKKDASPGETIELTGDVTLSSDLNVQVRDVVITGQGADSTTISTVDSRIIPADKSEFRGLTIKTDGSDAFYQDGENSVKIESVKFVDESGDPANYYAVRAKETAIVVRNSVFDGFKHGVLLNAADNSVIAKSSFLGGYSESGGDYYGTGIKITGKSGDVSGISIKDNLIKDQGDWSGDVIDGYTAGIEIEAQESTVSSIAIKRNNFKDNHEDVVAWDPNAFGGDGSWDNQEVDATGNYFGSDGIQVQGAVDASYAGLDAAESTRNFAVNSLGTDIRTFTRTLSEGSNMVSFPIRQGKKPVSEVIEDGSEEDGLSEDNVETVWTYQNGQWRELATGYGDSEEDYFRGGLGYIFHMTDSDTLSVNVNHEYQQQGDSTPESLELSSTWNLVGSYQEFDQSADSALSSLDNDYEAFNDELSCVEDMETGVGYWVTRTDNNGFTPSCS